MCYITKNFTDSEFDLTKIHKQSGYVDDELHLKFKGVYVVPPKEYYRKEKEDCEKLIIV